jgi:hypothetical protein
VSTKVSRSPNGRLGPSAKTAIGVVRTAQPTVVSNAGYNVGLTIGRERFGAFHRIRARRR